MCHLMLNRDRMGGGGIPDRCYAILGKTTKHENREVGKKDAISKQEDCYWLKIDTTAEAYALCILTAKWSTET